MMKQKLLTLALTCLLWNQNSNAELKVRFTEDSAADKASIKESIIKTAMDFWFAEEQFWKVVPVSQDLEIDFSLVSTDHLAQTRQHRINFNVYLPKADLDSTLRHELAHVFLNKQCPMLSDGFAQELFAYWRSGDYLRLLYGQKQLFTKADAFKELKSKSAFGAGKTVALARLINELVKNRNEEFLKTWFSDVLRQCQQTNFIQAQGNLGNEFLDKLQGSQSNRASNDSGFLIFDSLANEVLFAEGNWQKKQSVGSTLKPFAVNFFADLKKNRLKKTTAEWECGENDFITWDYKKALNYSCNGFFLDAQIKPKELTSYVETLNALTGSTFQSQWLNMADIIGLWPTLKLDLLGVAKIYDYVLETAPETVRVLKQTPVAGTLSGASDSKWFIENNISLKSGTTTNLDLSVETGFLVAIFHVGTTPKVAVLYRSGRRPIDLLPELKLKITKYLDFQDTMAKVQVLSSFKLNTVKVSCPTVLLKNGRTLSASGPIDLTNLNSPNNRLSCAGAPFEVHAHDKAGRRLYGDLTFQKLVSNAKVSEARSEKNARARLGSELILNTSEWHYLRSVFFSESGNYRQELKKAMLLVFKNNLGFWRNKKLPICDTTICQVFNLNYESVSPAQKKAVDDLILEMGNHNLGSSQWLEFSLGGDQPWTKDVGSKDLNSFLRTTELKNLEINKNGDTIDFVFGSSEKFTATCENVRTYFKFKSCPDSVESVDLNTFRFKGIGEGHERGMNLTTANQLAIQGFGVDRIIETFYNLKIKK